MSRLQTVAAPYPRLRTGFGGNLYVFCEDAAPLEDIARAIGRSPYSVYWRARHRCFALRVRRKADKALVRRMLGAELRCATKQGRQPRTYGLQESQP